VGAARGGCGRVGGARGGAGWLGEGVCRVAEVALRSLTCEGRGGMGRPGGGGALLVGSTKRGRYFGPAMSSFR
jgi:hypothetical protein